MPARSSRRPASSPWRPARTAPETGPELLRVLIGYSRCPFTRHAFELAGCDVWTCDLRPADHPQHLACDIWEILGDRWDFAVLHPMCTYLTCSAAWAYLDPDYEKWPDIGYHLKVGPDILTGAARREARQQAIENFARLLALPYPKAIENPGQSFVSAALRPADQIVQPYEFGDDGSKATGFWLDRVRPLRRTKYVPPRVIEYRGRMVRRWANQAPCGAPKLPPSADRWLTRSDTWPGIAAAMGEQWGTRQPDLVDMMLAS